MSAADPPLVNVDFNAMLDRTHVSLGTLGVKWDLERQGLTLREGLRLRAYDRDVDDSDGRNNFVCEGVAERAKANSSIHSKFDWVLALETCGHESDFRDDVSHWVHTIDWDFEERIRREWREQHPGSDTGLTSDPAQF